MKRALSSGAGLGLALMFFLSFAGCKKSDNSGGNTTAGNSTSTSSKSSSTSSGSSSGQSSSSKSSSSNRFVGTWRPANGSDLSVGSLTIKEDGTFVIKAAGTDGPSVPGSY